MTHSHSNLDLLTDAARQHAVRVAEAGHHTGLVTLLDEVLTDEAEAYRLNQDSRHSGDLAKKVDAVTDDACRAAHNAGLDPFRTLSRISHFEYVSEESGTRTSLLRPRTLITRCDPTDGTTNMLTTVSGYTTAVTVDIADDRLDRVRHLGGAIIGGGSVDISWVNSTTRSRLDGRHLQPTGQVFLRIPGLGRAWHRLPGLRDDRSIWTLAAVATSAERLDQIAPLRDKFLGEPDGRFFCYAGNPIAPGLLLGALSWVAEPNPTKLHDSVFLLPFTLLGGHVELLGEETEFDYLTHYEQHGTNLDAQAPVTPPYLARAR